MRLGSVCRSVYPSPATHIDICLCDTAGWGPVTSLRIASLNCSASGAFSASLVDMFSSSAFSKVDVVTAVDRHTGMKIEM